MYALGFLCLIASALAYPTASPARPPVIEYAVPLPMEYYAPPASILRTVAEDPKAEKGIVAAIPDAPALAPLGAPVVTGKPGEGKPMTVKIEMARPPIVHRLSLPWLPFNMPNIPIISNVISFLYPQSEVPARVYPYPLVG